MNLYKILEPKINLTFSRVSLKLEKCVLIKDK